MFKALQRYPKEFIFNMDETAWNFIYKRGEVVAEVSKKEVEAQLPEDIKNASQ